MKQGVLLGNSFKDNNCRNTYTSLSLGLSNSGRQCVHCTPSLSMDDRGSNRSVSRRQVVIFTFTALGSRCAVNHACEYCIHRQGNFYGPYPRFPFQTSPDEKRLILFYS